LIGSESAKPSSYHPTPRGSPPGVYRFSALFRTVLTLSTPLSASSRYASEPPSPAPKMARYPDTMLPFGRTISHDESHRRDQELASPTLTFGPSPAAPRTSRPAPEINPGDGTVFCVESSPKVRRKYARSTPRRGRPFRCPIPLPCLAFQRLARPLGPFPSHLCLPATKPVSPPFPLRVYLRARLAP